MTAQSTYEARYPIPDEVPKRTRREIARRAEEIGIPFEEALRCYETAKQVSAIWKAYRRSDAKRRKAAATSKRAAMTEEDKMTAKARAKGRRRKKRGRV